MAAPLTPHDSRVSRPQQPREEAVTAASPAEQILALTAELQERDRLVELLTERLEQAAEQLDRIHRTGGDRGPRGAGSPLPGDLAERQQAQAERLEAVLETWENAQTPALLERIDLRLDKLVDLLRGNSTGRTETATHTEPRTPDPVASSTAGPEGWAELKARLMREPSAVSAPPAVIPSQAVAAPQGTSTADPATEESDLPEPPAPIAEGEIDAQALLSAAHARDAYISALISEFRRYRRMQPIDWESAKDCPEELRTRMERLEHRLHKEVMREELALSLERARLAREQAQLEQLRTRLDKEIRRLGANPPEAEGESDKLTGSWTRVFGRKK